MAATVKRVPSAGLPAELGDGTESPTATATKVISVARPTLKRYPVPPPQSPTVATPQPREVPATPTPVGLLHPRDERSTLARPFARLRRPAGRDSPMGESRPRWVGHLTFSGIRSVAAPPGLVVTMTSV